ncbi:DegV family protein [Mycoplasmopsis columboralis]|uniref:Fatty acid-binding protein DegV-like protein n=1 Tax=Mycoplasmopsis columboralis TaxID=171282 RepID=A0A449B7B7_9BACT|nr:DegV family protein [Mycoplasmopsis columboralis]VEU76478.1 Fatty acid-binding protein DegV-like protein [Mycoplasmopsis columboralis]
MKNVAIVVDSSCGLTKEQAQLKGWFYLPLNIEIDQHNYLDGINLTSQNLFEKFSKDSKGAKTSSTNIGYALDLLKELSNKFEYVVVFPISKYLSGQNKNLSNFAREFTNVYVIESLFVAQLISLKAMEFMNLINSGTSVKEAIKIIENWDERVSVSLMPKYNDFLVKGGRLTPSAAAIANLFKIVPIIKFENGKLEKEGKGRVFSKTVFNVIDQKFENSSSDENELIILHSQNSEINSYVEYAKQKYNLNASLSIIPPVISIHTGPEAVVVIKYPKLTKQQKELF